VIEPLPAVAPMRARYRRSALDDDIGATAGNGSITYALNGGAPVTLSGVTSFTFNGKDGDDTITVNLPATGAIVPGDIASTAARAPISWSWTRTVSRRNSPSAASRGSSKK